MTDPKKGLDRLQREVDDARTDADRALKGDPPKPVLYRQQTFGLDSVLTGAAMLIVLGLSVSLASQLTKDQVTALTAGSVGAAGGPAWLASVCSPGHPADGLAHHWNHPGPVPGQWGLRLADSRGAGSSLLQSPSLIKRF